MAFVQLTDRIAVVTGSGRGIGRAHALELARRGAAVVVNDIGIAPTGQPRAELVAEEIVSMGGVAVATGDDISEPEGGEALIAHAVATFGRVDIVVNNAGSIRAGLFGELDPSDIRTILDVHLLGSFNVTQPAWRFMKQQGHGRVVLTSSSAVFGQEANSNYIAAKAGLLGLTRALAVEGAVHGIRANCVLPYANSVIAVDNPIPGEEMGRLRKSLGALLDRQDPAGISALVAYLVSDECQVTGEMFSALAGRYSRLAFVLSEGWLSENIQDVTAESIRDNFDQICRMDTLTFPASLLDEVDQVRSILGRTIE